MQKAFDDFIGSFSFRTLILGVVNTFVLLTNLIITFSFRIHSLSFSVFTQYLYVNSELMNGSCDEDNHEDH
jgi:hypothetical protein